MDLWIKRFLNDIGLVEAYLLSATAASISLHVTHLQPVLQFVVSASAITIISTIVYSLNHRLGTGNSFLILFSFLIASAKFLPETLAASFLIGLFFTPLIFLRRHRLFISAILAHLLDVASTLSQVSVSEANPFMSYTMNQLGALPGLLIPKIVLVFLPMYWAYQNFGKEEMNLFLKLVFALGISMAVRNFTLTMI